MTIRAKKTKRFNACLFACECRFSIFAELSLNALKIRFLQHGLGAMCGFAVHFCQALESFGDK